ncbi:MAG: PAS domain S-box protein, partial [Chloroflexales bacterium]|nr:PAS domain S-box protein [Chloroflexales bacterium]
MKHVSYEQLREENQALRARLAEAERLLAERTAAERRARAILDRLDTGVLLIDADERCIFANARAAGIFHLPPAELVGTALVELLPPAAATAYQAHTRRLLTAPAAEEQAATVTLPIGTRTFVVADQVLAPTQGEGAVRLSSWSDTTEDTRAEDALRESEARYRGLFDHMAEGYAYCQMIFAHGVAHDWIYCEVNAAFEALTGLHDVRGKRVSEAIPGIRETDPELFAIYARVALTGTHEKFERFVDALQQWFSVSVYSPARDYFVAVFDVITERKRTEAELQVALTKYRTLFDAFPLGITVSDATGQIVESNPMAERLLSLGREEQRQREIDGAEWQIVRPDGTPMPPEEYASVQALREQRLVANVEMGVITPRGATTWINVMAAPLPLEDYGVVIAYSDITARRQAEAALRESQQNLEALIENTDGSIWSVDAQYRLIVGNRRFHQDASTIIGRQMKSGDCVLVPELPQAALDEWRAYYDRALHQGPFSVEATRRFTAEPHTIEYRLSPITTATGQRAGVTVYSRDITARKRIEAALRESEARYRLLSEHSADVIWTMDLASFRFTYVSPSVQRLRGYTVEEVLAQPVEAALTPESNQRIASQLSARLAAFLDGDEAARTAVSEVDQPCKDGTIVPTEVATTFLTNAQGRVTTVLGVSRDITARRRAEAALRQLNETLEQRVAARTAELARANVELARAARLKDEFLATMSHELRTPLSSILGRLELLQEELDGPLTPRQVASLHRIETSGQQLLALINDILDLSTIEAGKLTLARAAVDVALVCQRSRQQVSASALKKRMMLSTTLDP